MALANNLVLEKKPGSAAAEAMAQRRPGDKMRITVDVTVVENLPDRASYDVDGAEFGGVAEAAEPAGPASEEGLMAQSILSVMARKKK